MSNASTTEMEHAPPPAEPAATWSPAQLVRLEGEWRRVRRDFAFHPVVRVTPAAGDPPVEYIVDYRLTTLAIDETGQLAYVDACAVHVWLPPQFPHAGPVLRPVGNLFHPNVSPEQVVLTPAWNPATSTLSDAIARCGELLAFQIYDPAAVVNASAMAWVRQYPQLVPTDGQALPAPDAGDTPLARIAHFGPEALDKHAAALAAMSQGICDGSPGTARADVRRFGGQVSFELGLFADRDVAESLRTRAAELDTWARSMTVSRSVWDDLRSTFASARAAEAAARHVRAARDAIAAALVASDALVSVEPSTDVLETLARLPDVSVLEPVALSLRGALREAEAHVAALRAALEGVSGPPLMPVGAPGGPLHARTSDDVTRAGQAAATAREIAAAELAAIEPVLARAQVERAALDNCVTWAAFVDLMRRGNEMTQRLLEVGAGGIQACYLQTPGGMYGPYAFEERVEAGAALLIIRRTGAAAPVEVFDARSMARLGMAPSVVAIKLADTDGRSHDVQVRATEHVDELRVPLDYLLKTSREQVAQLGHSAGGKAPSWAGRFTAALAGQLAVHEAAEVYRRASHRWMALLHDLDELAGFKERLATHHLLERHAAFVAALLAARGKAAAQLDDANDRLAFIGSRSTTDDATGAVIVPAELAADNAEQLVQRTRAEKDLAKIEKLLCRVTAELQSRLSDARLRGKPGLPKLRLLKMPANISADVLDRLSDAHLNARREHLERLLGIQLVAGSATTAPATPPRAHSSAAERTPATSTTSASAPSPAAERRQNVTHGASRG